MTEKVMRCDDDTIKKDWEYLQSSDHFYYMATKFFSDGSVHAYFNPYETPYDAFMNYMNVLSDFEIRVNRGIPAEDDQAQAARLNLLLAEKDKVIEKQAEEIKRLAVRAVKAKPRAKPAVRKKKLAEEVQSEIIELDIEPPKAAKRITRVKKTRTGTPRKTTRSKTPVSRKSSKK
jgi:alpha-amylase